MDNDVEHSHNTLPTINNVKFLEYGNYPTEGDRVSYSIYVSDSALRKKIKKFWISYANSNGLIVTNKYEYVDL